MQGKKMEKSSEIKRLALSHISHVLTQGKIPHVYNVGEETITLRNIDMTDVLLELHYYDGECIADLHNKIFRLEKLVESLKHCNNCKYHHITGCVFEDKKECDWQSKAKWELCK